MSNAEVIAELKRITDVLLDESRPIDRRNQSAWFIAKTLQGKLTGDPYECRPGLEPVKAGRCALQVPPALESN